MRSAKNFGRCLLKKGKTIETRVTAERGPLAEKLLTALAEKSAAQSGIQRVR